MNKTQVLSAVSYITWIGWIVAFILGDRTDRVVRQHINQALNLNIVGILVSAGTRIGGPVEWVAGIIGTVALVFTIWGIIRALKQSAEPLPFIGNVNLI
ncbi:MAG: DUF4870 domain-containing protein [Firmicutes bacterium]|nr:DUF4870 domain-containing protein [Bacillota bacterium]